MSSKRPQLLPTPGELAKVFRYSNGTLIRIGKLWRGGRIGERAGFHSKKGYRCVSYANVSYPEHRVIWALCKGQWPKNQIDHINGIPSDNRIENLRDVTQSENFQNKEVHRLGATPGITFHQRDRRWRARAPMRKHLGSFKTKEEAVQCLASYLREEA